MYTLTEASRLLHARRLSCLELTKGCLANIERLNPLLNAFITVTAELAEQQARTADAEIAAGNYRGPLHGIPIALKDLIDVAGVPTTAASRQLQNHFAIEDAEIVARLKRAGAVIVGKTNLHEFAFGGSGMVSAYGPALNPWDVTRITGGSSSGSAAAVAAGMCVAAVGTDTAGSIRTPAALCGIVGHRPSAGVWSNEGIIPLRKSFDTAGPMTRTVEDARLLLHALCNVPPQPAGSSEHVRIGVAREGFFDNLDADVSASVAHALDVLASLFGSTRDVTLEFDTSWTSFDGEILEYHQAMLDNSPELYQQGTLARLRTCTTQTSELFEAAKNALAKERRRAEEVFRDVDVVVTPTCVVAAPAIADLQKLSATELRAYEVNYLLRNTAPFSLLFWPTVSVPCGFTPQGLPVGLQISAAPGCDDVALHVAEAYEQATAWHKRLPPLPL
jgi:Asp-tRNA(Asn)/Glu-tRNA(Gln) amidotransferase A subunit family amidase